MQHSIIGRFWSIIGSPLTTVQRCHLLYTTSSCHMFCDIKYNNSSWKVILKPLKRTETRGKSFSNHLGWAWTSAMHFFLQAWGTLLAFYHLCLVRAHFKGPSLNEVLVKLFFNHCKALIVCRLYQGKSFCKTESNLSTDRAEKGQKQGRDERTQKDYRTFAKIHSRCPIVFCALSSLPCFCPFFSSVDR